MRHGSLFSGIGGFDLAAQWMGWQNIFQVENNPFCRRVLSYHFPDTTLIGDIKEMKGEKYHGTIDIISAGFPCQPFSLAGKRKGRGDYRYLWPETLRIITEIRPRWIVLENVAGLLSILDPESFSAMECKAPELYSTDDLPPGNTTLIQLRRRIIGTILSEIGAAGYLLPRFTDGTPVVLCIPACAVGAPHRRDRIWLVAHANSLRSHDTQIGQGHCQGDDYDQAGAQATLQSEGCGDPPTGKITSYTGGQSGSSQTGTGREVPRHEGEQLRSKSGNTGQDEPLANAHGHFRREGWMYAAESETATGLPRAHHPWDYRYPWANFPTQSPVCRRNDGISAQLDALTFSKWRTGSIHAFGNAIVPQVAYQIFNAIAQFPDFIKK